MSNWNPPDTWKRITAIDAHTGGEPLRILTGGFPDLPGNTILEKRGYARKHFDNLRKALMWEPRGHADMYGCILTPPVNQGSDVGVLFMHNEGFSTMCGHGIIGLVKVGVEARLLDIQASQTEIRIDTPAGLVVARAHMNGERVERVSFKNVPSFVLEKDLKIDVPDLGSITCDIAFGGAFYAYVDVDQVGLEINPTNQRKLIDAGMKIKHAVMDSYKIIHPEGDDDLNFLYGTIFVKMLQDSSIHSRNVCIFADGEVDRCPTGTGVSGRLAIHGLRGELEIGETITIESIISTQFTGTIIENTSVGDLPAIIPEVSGTAHITGMNELLFDPEDPLTDGFFLR